MSIDQTLRFSRLLAFAALTACIALAATTSAGAEAPAYPTRLVRIIVPLPAGGPGDAIVRAIADRLSARLGQPFVPEFRGGAAGIIGTDLVAKAEPDGYTLLAATSDMLVNNIATFKRLPYDPQKDFSFITQLGTLPLLFAVHAAVPAGDLGEFAAYAGERRGKLSFGSWGHGINAHIAGELLLNRRLDAGAAHIAYRGLKPLTQDLVGQQITASFGVVPAFEPFARTKQLKILGVTGKSRVAAFPDVKTFAEQGFEEEAFQLRVWMAFLAPANTPRWIIQRLNQEIVLAVRSAEMAAKLATEGFELLGNTPEEAREHHLRELDIIPRLMNDIGIIAQ